jgi:hypothetical protein
MFSKTTECILSDSVLIKKDHVYVLSVVIFESSLLLILLNKYHKISSIQSSLLNDFK